MFKAETFDSMELPTNFTEALMEDVTVSGIMSFYPNGDPWAGHIMAEPRKC